MIETLPIAYGTQTFQTIRENNNVYVDKTRFIEPLIANPAQKFFFLSRPRRFGKSLFLSTLKSLFLGEKELFEGLYIYDKVKFEKYPVIHIDWSGMDFTNNDWYEKSLKSHLIWVANTYEVLVDFSMPPDTILNELIIKLYEKYGQIVVLIDEYDKPITDTLKNIEITERNRTLLRELYSNFKKNDFRLRFVFLTGVSRFAKIAIFSGLNNLVDLTFQIEFNEICGFTQQELDDHYGRYLEEARLAMGENSVENFRKEVKLWYNGYNWGGKETVYNPVSISKLCLEKQFGGFWFQTGTPLFLVEEIKKQPVYLPEFEEYNATPAMLESQNLEKLNILALLWQTGYLTIRRVERETPYSEPEYILAYPNLEVKNALLECLLPAYIEAGEGDSMVFQRKVRNGLRSGNAALLMEGIEYVFAAVPYQLHLKKETYYHTIVYILFKSLGINVKSEISVSTGRLDATVELLGRVWVVEFKYAEEGDGDALAQTALDQIIEKNYAAAYKNDPRPVHLLGVAIVKKQVYWIEQKLDA